MDMQNPGTSDKWDNIAPLAYNKIFNMAITGKHYIVPIKIAAGEILKNIKEAKSHVKTLNLTNNASNMTKEMIN